MKKIYESTNPHQPNLKLAEKNNGIWKRNQICRKNGDNEMIISSINYTGQLLKYTSSETSQASLILTR